MTIPKEITIKNSVMAESAGWISVIPFRYHLIGFDFDRPLFMLENYFEILMFKNVLVAERRGKFVRTNT
jgi:hypothetical protein